MNQIKKLWTLYGTWVLIGLPIAIIVLAMAVNAAKPAARIVTEPPAESESASGEEPNRAYTADDGVVVIGSAKIPAVSVASTDTSETAVDAILKVASAYTLPEDVQLPNGSIGALTIAAIRLKANVYETDDEIEVMTRGLAHFKTTSAWEGNIGLCGHNQNFDLTDGLFKNLHKLKPGDSILYKTALGGRKYEVETIAEITETDWSYLGRTDDNRITLVTCISGKPRMRLVVQAVES